MAFATRGNGFDIQSYELVRDALRGSQPLDLYSTVNTPTAPHWPYPGGFLPWVLGSDLASRATNLRFDGFIQTAPILADAALAWIVQRFLGHRGMSDRARLTAAALVLLGPAFWIVSGFHGQLDAVAILPAVLALLAWQQPGLAHRAIVAGLLVGLAGSIKAVPLVVAVALLPSSRSVREGVTLMATAALVPLLSVAPFLLANLDGTIEGLRANKGLPGFGGFSLLVQPDLSALWLGTKPGVELSPLSQRLFDHGSPFAIGALLATGALLLWGRVEPLLGVILMWLAVFAFGINFSLTYMVWGIPFFLMAGHIGRVGTLQVALTLPLVMLELRVRRDLPLEVVYTPIMLLVWVAFVAWFAQEALGVLRSGRGPEPPPQPGEGSRSSAVIAASPPTQAASITPT